MTPATLDAPTANAETAKHATDYYASLTEEICNNAVRVQLWDNRELTTCEFRYDARRSQYKEMLAQKYCGEIETYLPYFEKKYGPIHANDLSKLPQFLKECAACFSYLYALKRRNHTALSFDNDTDKVWANRMEVKEIEEQIEELQYDLQQAEAEYDELVEREVEAAEKAEKQKGGL